MAAAEHHSVLYEPANRLWESAVHATGLESQLGGTQVADHVVMGLLVLAIIAAIFIPLRSRLSLENPGKLQHLLEVFVGAFSDLMDDVVGHGSARKFMPMIGALAVFIFFSNMLGLVFFLQPPTGNLNTTFALSITAFLYYHSVGLRAHGLAYFKQFLGPLPALMVIFIPLEIISHCARALSLGLRLFGNIFGEHTVTGVFFMIPFLIPFPMMALGIFGGVLQTYIFCLL